MILPAGGQDGQEITGLAVLKAVKRVYDIKNTSGWGTFKKRGGTNMSSGDIVKLIISIVVCEGAGVIGSIFTVRNIPTWYKSLKKPPFTPPNQVFGPVWITLYLLMGLAVFFIWRGGFTESGSVLAFTLFWIQLVINILWSVVFFGRKAIFGGVVVILLMWLLILATIVSSFTVSSVAGGLLIPYIIWVTIASYLNIGVWRLNPAAPAEPAAGKPPEGG